MRKTNRFLIVLSGIALAALLVATPVSAYRPAVLEPVQEEPMYYSYNYVTSGGSTETISVPVSYMPAFRLDSNTLGITLQKPVDLFEAEDGSLYLVDQTANAIVVMDDGFNVQQEIITFINNGVEDHFNEPQGVFVTEEKIYVADTENHRVVILYRDGTLCQVLTLPESVVISDDLTFAPQKLAVDAAGRIYVVVRGAYEGIMEFYSDGAFGGYVGSIPVENNVLLAFWKSVMGEEQRSKLQQFIPVEYTNLSIDQDGFLYTVSVASGNVMPIRRINSQGNDILVRNSLNGLGVEGDIIPDETDKSSSFVDICSDTNGRYFALDSQRGRVFTYDNQGNLLYLFGGMNSTQVGTFQQATAIAMAGEYVAVVDAANPSVTLFKETDYAAMIRLGMAQYNEDEYLACIATWQSVLKYNQNCLLAYSKIGQAYYRMEQYEDAMAAFRLARDREGYSKATYASRQIWVRNNFNVLILCVFGLFMIIGVLIFLWRRHCRTHPLRPSRIREDIRQLFHTLIHPMDGFWDLKYEKKGRLWVAIAVLALTVFTSAFSRSVTGFCLNTNADAQPDMLFELKFVLLPFAVFLVGNISITTLMDGKGRFKELFIASSYALTPMCLIHIPLAIISNVLTMEEQVFVQIFSGLAVVWVAFLLYSALLCTHEYTPGKTLATILLTAVAMVILLFVCILFFSLLSELVGFVYTVYDEIVYRF